MSDTVSQAQIDAELDRWVNLDSKPDNDQDNQPTQDNTDDEPF